MLACHSLTHVRLQYHSDETRNRAGSVMPAEEYRVLQYRAASAPLFVLPLGKGQGRSLSMLLQWQLPHCLFTELDHYKQCAPMSDTPALCTLASHAPTGTQPLSVPAQHHISVLGLRGPREMMSPRRACWQNQELAGV